MSPDELADEAYSSMKGSDEEPGEKKEPGDYELEALVRKMRKALEAKDDAAAARFLKQAVEAC